MKHLNLPPHTVLLQKLDGRLTYASGTSSTALHTIAVERKPLTDALLPGISASTQLFPQLAEPGGTNTFSGRVITKITFDNEAKYEVWYNEFGEVAKLLLPTGGRVEYVHGPGVAEDATNAVYGGGRILDPVVNNATFINGSSCQNRPAGKPIWQPFIYRRVLQRRVYPNSTTGTPELAVRYDAGETVTGVTTHALGKSAVVISFAGYVEVTESLTNSFTQPDKVHRHFSHPGLMGGPASPLAKLQWAKSFPEPGFVSFPDPMDGKTVKTETGKIGSNNVLEFRSRAETVWGAVADGSVRACQEVTTVRDRATLNDPWTSKSKAVLKLYDAHENATAVTTNVLKTAAGDSDSADQEIGVPRVRFSLLTDTYEYDWGAGPSVGTSCPVAAADYLRRMHTDYLAHSNAAYRLWTGHLWELPSKVTVYGVSGAKDSEMSFRYDEGSPLARGAVSGRDAAAPAIRGNLTSIETALTGTSSTTVRRDYDDLGNIIAERDGREKQTDYDYVDAPDGAGGTPASATYAFLTKLTLPAAGFGQARHVTTWKVNYRSGRVVQAKLPNESTLKYIYEDPLERLTKVEKRFLEGDQAPYQVVNHEYTDTQNAVAVVTRKALLSSDDKKTVTRACFDGWGREFKSAAGDGAGADENVRGKWIDGFGRVKEVSRASFGSSDCAGLTAGSGTATTFDELDRPVTVVEPGGATTTISYVTDARTIQDAAGKCRKLINDGLGRLKQVVEDSCAGGLAYATDYVYDGQNRLKSVTQGAQAARTFTYDLAGRLTATSYPESGVTNYKYDANGNLIWRKDARGAEYCFGALGANETCDGNGYDDLSRPVWKSYKAAGTGWVATPEVRYCYDGQTYAGGSCTGAPTVAEAGQLTGTGNSESVSEYVHDRAGRLTRYKQSLNGLNGAKEFGYTYFAGDTIAEKEYPSMRRVRTCPDVLGRGKWVSATKSISDCVSGTALFAGDGYASGVTYAAGGGMAQWTLGSGRVGAAKYNERDQPVRMRLSLASNAEQVCGTTGDDWCIELGYGGTAAVNNGNVREQKIWAKKANGTYLNIGQSYGYDGLNRLTVFGESVLGGGSSGGSWSQTNEYDRWGNRWASSTIAQSFLTPGQQSWINAATNRVQTAIGGAVGHLASGEMSSHPQIGGMTWDVEGRMRTAGTATFAYDGNGVRVKKVAGGVTTYYVGDGMGQLGAEYGGAAAVSTTRYVMADHLGSTRVVTDGAGVVTALCDYSGFGETLWATASVGNRDLIGVYACGDGSMGLRYTGKERDAETGLDYFGARYFSGAMGRFTSPDPLLSSAKVADPQSWNRYVYALNNPLVYVDPTGEEPIPAKIQQYVTRYAPSALRTVGQAGRALDITQTILSNARSIGLMSPVTIGGPAASAAEREQAGQVARMTGNDVLLVDNPKNQGFDSLQIVGGFVKPSDAIPTELKGLTSANPQAVLTETVATERAANGVTLPGGDKLTGVQIFISAPNMNANSVASFASNGPLPGIVGRSSVQRVTVTTPNGTVTIQRNQVTVRCNKTGDDGSCQ